jgi:hypothetical protein
LPFYSTGIQFSYHDNGANSIPVKASPSFRVWDIIVLDFSRTFLSWQHAGHTWPFKMLFTIGFLMVCIVSIEEKPHKLLKLLLKFQEKKAANGCDEQQEQEREAGRERKGGEQVATTTYSERRDVEGLERESRGLRSKHQPQYRSYASEQKQENKKASHQTTAAPYPL